MLGLPAFGFVEPGPLRDELTALVLAGVKVATASLVPVPGPAGRAPLNWQDLLH